MARQLIRVAVLAFATCSSSSLVAADAAPAPGDAAKSQLDQLLAKRHELAAQVASVSQADARESSEVDVTDVSAAEEALELLQTIDGVYAQQQARLEQRQELAAAKKEADDALGTLRKFGPTEAKPYSFLLLETLRDELAVEEERQAACRTDLAATEQMLERARNHFDQCERDRRLAQEAFDENEDPALASELAETLKVDKFQSQLAGEQITLRRFEVEVRNLRVEVSTLRHAYLDEKVATIAKDVKFTKQDLQARHRELASEDAELKLKLRAARVRFQRAEAKQNAAVKQLQSEQAPAATMKLAAESWRAARDSHQMEISLINQRIGDTQRLRHYWTCRFELENGTAEADSLSEWRESLKGLLDEFQDNQRSLVQKIESARDELARLVQRSSQEEDEHAKSWLETQEKAWAALRDTCENNLVQLKASERWCGRFLDQLVAKIEPPAEQTWWKVAQEKLGMVWNYEIAAVDDHPVTLGKVATLILYVTVGIILSSVLSRLIGRVILPRFGLNQGASGAVQKILFYCLAVVFGSVSFQLVHIPFTAFAFLGGAAAIALGFGSQDIANNFMSGIILLAEQPIRVGDVVIFGGVQGTVTHIGPRSTWIKNDFNHELIVPNSLLLSDKVTNLTLSDDLVQASLAISVPNTRTLRQAKQALLQGAMLNESVLTEPTPVVLLKQYGTSTLDLELRFWLHMSDSQQAAVVQSEVRETITDLFAQLDAQANTPRMSKAA